MERWASLDVDGFLAYLEGADVIEFQSAAPALGYVAAVDTERVLELVVSAPASVTDLIQTAAAAALARSAPEQAAALTIHRGESLAGMDSARAIAVEYARRDPALAVEWATTSNTSRMALLAVAQEIGARDLAEALRYVDSIPGSSKADWVAAAVTAFADQDPDYAIVVIDAYRNEPFYDAAVEAVVRHLARSDPAAASHLLVGVGESARRLAIPAVAEAWARRNSTEAAQWAAGLAGGELRELALRAVATVESSRSERLIEGISSIPSRDDGGFTTSGERLQR